MTTVQVTFSSFLQLKNDISTNITIMIGTENIQVIDYHHQ